MIMSWKCDQPATPWLALRIRKAAVVIIHTPAAKVPMGKNAGIF